MTKSTTKSKTLKTIKTIKRNSKNEIDNPKGKYNIDKNKTHKYNFQILDMKASKQPFFPNQATIPNTLQNNKQVALKSIEVDPVYFLSISNKLKDDMDIGKLIMEKNPVYFKNLSERLRDNKQLAIIAIKNNGENYNFISDRLKIDTQILNLTNFSEIITKDFLFKEKINKPEYLTLLKALSKYNVFNKNLFLSVTNDVINDKNIVIKTLLLSKQSYESIPIHLKKDDDVIEALIKNKAFDIDDINRYFPNYNKAFAIFVMKYHPNIYPKLKSEFINDKDVVLSALKSNTRITSGGYYIRDILPFIPENIKNDKEIKSFLELKKNKYYFHTKYNNDKPFIMKNVHRWNTFKFASKRLQNDKDVVISALTNPARGKYDPDNLLQYTSSKLRNDKDVFLQMLENKIKVKRKETLKLIKQRIKKCKLRV